MLVLVIITCISCIITIVTYSKYRTANKNLKESDSRVEDLSSINAALQNHILEFESAKLQTYEAPVRKKTRAKKVITPQDTKTVKRKRKKNS